MAIQITQKCSQVLKQLSIVTITYGILKQTKCSQVLKQLSKCYNYLRYFNNKQHKTSNNIIHHKQLLADTNQCDVTIRFLCGFETMVLLSRRSEEIVFFVELGDFAHSSLPV